MSIFGGASKADKQQQQGIWSNLDKLFQNTQATGNQLGAKGQNAQDLSAEFFKRLVSGNRTDALSAVAPAASAATEMSDASKREQSAKGTSRGGGNAGANQQREFQTHGQIDTLIGQLAPTAASELNNIGISDINAMMQSLGLSGSVGSELSGEITGNVNQKNANAAAMWSSLIGGGLKLATALPGLH